MEPVFKTALTKYGRFSFPPNDIYIGRSLEIYGEYCDSELTLMRHFLRADDVCVDAGSNVGAFSIPLARHVGESGIVYAFEPQPFLASLVSQNALNNDCANVRCLTVAVGSGPGTVKIPNFNYRVENNFGGVGFKKPADNLVPGAGHLDVPVVRLDDTLDINRLRLIKADVEGMEIDLLKGADGLIKEFQPALYLECDIPAQAEPTLSHLDRIGYKGFWHASLLFNPKNFNNVAEDVFGNIVCVNLLAVPKSAKINGLKEATGPASHPKLPPK